MQKASVLNKDTINGYAGLYKKRLILSLVFLILLAGILILSIRVGAYSISALDIISVLSGRHEGDTLHHVIWNIRLPRSIGAIVAGASLGLAGLVMQNVLKNPLASPFTLGVTQGAAFGAAFAIIILGAGKIHSAGNVGVTVTSQYLVVLCAFCGALMTVMLILLLSSIRNMGPESIILAGVAVSALWASATMLIQYFASDVHVSATVFWTFGDLGKAGWMQNGIISVFLVFAFFFFLYNSWNYNALMWGDESAKSLGVNVKTLRVISMVVTSLLVSTVTAFLGIIGFIGLISPHIVRFVIGSDYRFLIPCTTIFGGFLLLLSDTIARTIMSPVVLPVGIITSFAGAPMFLYLLMRGRRL